MRYSLAVICVLGVVAQLVPAVGDVLARQTFIGGSFAAFIAYVLFDAITTEKPLASSGMRVLRSIDELRECASRAFDHRDVSVDFYGFTSETLLQITRTPMQRLADEARGHYRVRIRVLTPDLQAPMNLPCRLVPDGGPDVQGHQHYNVVDDLAFREQMQAKIDESKRIFAELKAAIESSIPGARVEILFRVASYLSPQSKLLLFNDDEACQGSYPVEVESIAGVESARRLNPKGFTVGGMVLVSKRGGPTARDLFEQHRRWFEHHWALAERVH
ncbi:hypothetical protein ABZ883_26075 [Streptomyces sp. NPDC046977]|uniref:hypothetical protein n=1 Tax=Streptomyces sp. NPDC046977 TaxID=3154703 RepID=UPI0033EEE101